MIGSRQTPTRPTGLPEGISSGGLELVGERSSQSGRPRSSRGIERVEVRAWGEDREFDHNQLALALLFWCSLFAGVVFDLVKCDTVVDWRVIL